MARRNAHPPLAAVIVFPPPRSIFTWAVVWPRFTAETVPGITFRALGDLLLRAGASPHPAL